MANPVHAPAMDEAAKLEHADALQSLTEQPDGAEHHAEPLFLGFAPPAMVVAAAMLVLIIGMLVKRVPAMVTDMLDGQIASIRKQLAEAKALRAEAEALRSEYATKIANAEKDAAAMLDHARHEADAIVAKAEADTADLIARREKMATDKIGAAERAAVDELRARAAAAATEAARRLIADNLGADRDKVLVDAAIDGVGKH